MPNEIREKVFNFILHHQSDYINGWNKKVYYVQSDIFGTEKCGIWLH